MFGQKLIGAAMAAAVILIVSLASMAAAQSAPWRLVQPSDGSLWVIADGVRHRVAPANIADAELAAIPEGGAWSDGSLADAPSQQPPTQPGRVAPNEGYSHAAQGEPITYQNRPPSSGTHYPTWTRPGVYPEPQPTGNWVHSLEHGYVVILYNCPDACPDLAQQLAAFYEAAPKSAHYGYQKLIVQPYADMDHRIAIVAWAHVDELDAFDPTRLRAFYDAYHDHGPEDAP